eukprot:c9028_g1_i2.p1 GENE.c9028_g1_i2~~c9028_g1_i2.p1  ORF type:complete len:148 (+),score=40.21 c9028_g1_i2:64-444(+)
MTDAADDNLAVDETHAEAKIAFLQADADEQTKSLISAVTLDVFNQNRKEPVKVCGVVKDALMTQAAAPGETWNVVMGRSFGLSAAFTPKTLVYLRVYEDKEGVKDGRTLFCLLAFKSAERVKPKDS